MINSILFFLYCFNYFILSFWIIGTTITVAWNVSCIILTTPLSLGHMHPSLRLRFNSNCWYMNMIYKSSLSMKGSNWLGSLVSIKLFKTRNPFKLFCFRSDYNSSCDWKIQRRSHSTSINKPSTFKLLSKFCTNFI